VLYVMFRNLPKTKPNHYITEDRIILMLLGYIKMRWKISYCGIIGHFSLGCLFCDVLMLVTVEFSWLV
jgi:hypothetical protein